MWRQIGAARLCFTGRAPTLSPKGTVRPFGFPRQGTFFSLRPAGEALTERPVNNLDSSKPTNSAERFSMKFANSAVNTRATFRVLRPFGLGLHSTLLILILLAAVSSASAAITFDHATASKAKHNTDVISWEHTIGGGADAAVVVAVSFNDLSGNNNQIASVNLGGVAMRPVPNSLARSTGWHAQTTTQ